MLFEKIKFLCLEIHVSHSCNLNCVSCSHFSDQKHKGVVSIEELEDWCGLWPQKIQPMEINLLGGEPTLNKNLMYLIYFIRSKWQKSKINLITNGFFLNNHELLPVVLEKTKCNLIISIHHDSLEYTNKIEEIKKTIEKWKQKNRFNVEWRESYKNWKILFKNKGSAMTPFQDNDPKKSWQNCESKHTKQLFKGKIWKCPPLAYLDMQNEKYNMDKIWSEYLKYRPADIKMNYKELFDFLNLQEETYCSMCPANPQKVKKPNPLRSN